MKQFNSGPHKSALAMKASGGIGWRTVCRAGHQGVNASGNINLPKPQNPITLRLKVNKLK
jgi:hypothetical protein